MNPQARFDIVGDDKSKAAVASALSGMSSLVSKAGVVGAAIGVVSSVSLPLLLKSQLEAADAMSKLSQEMGVTTESASALAYAADFSGVSNEQLSASFKNLSGNMLESQRAGSDQQKLFSALGVSAVDMDGNLRSADDVMADLADSFAGMPDGVLKTDAAVKLFGKSGMEMLPMLNGGSDGLADMRHEAEMFGNVISGDTGKSAEEFNDNLTRMAWIGKGIANEVLPAMLAGLNLLANAFGVGAKSAGNQTYQMAEQLTKLNDQYKSLYLNVETTRKAADGGNEYAQKALGGYQAAANKVLGEIKAVEDKIAAINSGSGVNTKALTAALSGDKGPKKTKDKGDNDIDQEIEAQRKAMIALYTEAYPLAMQTTEQWGQEQARIAQEYAASVASTEAAGRDALASHEADLMQRVFSEEQSQMTAEQRQLAVFEKRRLMVDEAAARDIISEQRQTDLLVGIEKDRQQKITEAAKNAMQARLAVASGMMSNMSSLMQSDSKKQFDIGKKFALATAVIKGYEAIQSSYAAGTKIGGPWLGAAYAATAAVATKVNIDAIRNQSFGGGGGGGSGGGGSGGGSAVPTDPNSGVPQVPINSGANDVKQRQAVTINIYGNVVDMSQLSRELRTYNIQLERDTI